MLDIFIPFFSFSSTSELILGILHLLLRPTSVSFNLLLVRLSGGVIRLARSVHRSCIAVGTGETRTAIATSRNLASSVRADSNQGTDSLPGRSHEAACDVLVVDVDRDHLSCSTVDHLADGCELGSCRGNCQEGTHLVQTKLSIRGD